MNIKLSSCRLESVSCGCAFAFSDDLIDATLGICACKVTLFKQETHETHERLFGRCYQVLVPDDIDRLAVLFGAVTDQNFEESLHLGCLSANEPVPVTGVVAIKLIFGLVAMTQSVAK